MRDLCLESGLPKARSAVIEGAQLDLYWPEAQLVVEADGAAVHHTRRAFHADRAKDRALAALGIQVLRVTQRDLDQRQRLGHELRTVYFARRAS